MARELFGKEYDVLRAKSPGTYHALVDKHGRVVARGRSFSKLGENMLDLATTPENQAIARDVHPVDYIREQKGIVEARLTELITELEEKIGTEIYDLSISRDSGVNIRILIEI